MEINRLAISNDGDDVIYCDITAFNNKNEISRADINISRTSPIINNPKDYLMSIVRFSVQVSSLPLFIWFNDSPNMVSIKYNNIIKSFIVPYQNTQINSTPYQQIIGDAVYTYHQFSNMINSAIKSCHDDLKISGEAPYLTFNDNSSLYTMNFSTLYLTTDYPYNDANKPKLYFNNLLATYMFNFNNITYKTNDNGLYCDYQIICTDNKNNRTYDNNGLIIGYTNTQEYNGSFMSNSFTSLNIVSNNLPVNGDAIMNTSIHGGISTQESLKIVSDFEIDKGRCGEQRSLIQYQAQNNRYIAMQGKGSLYNLNLQIYIYLVERQIYVPLYMMPYEVATIKVMFKKKSLNY